VSNYSPFGQLSPSAAATASLASFSQPTLVQDCPSSQPHSAATVYMQHKTMAIERMGAMIALREDVTWAY
jgi:hypothetical protein